ncbi:MAG: phosphopentomutase [Coriobacteriaceae bacterium]|uniref:phosphopentomutase n=1 Tax=Tractidigestivibacter sp. TaxID=2847320 RepID=UPI002A834E6B|nr:phosphopentomutase [Tractidigestivibacter sp.]MCI6549024.1 phosphopentomutase [Coriobacteriaceae bacterium]MCI7439613.1 phosphopentomutase [Coriobacteriaceae bacterium]
MGKRVFLIVLDSFGIGAEPDAAEWGDEGSNTLCACATTGELAVPNMASLGLLNIEGALESPYDAGLSPVASPIGAFARLREASAGKDTTVGHWEMAGVISPKRFPTYPNGFPREVLDEFERQTGRGVLCNRPCSGTQVIEEYGREQLETGKLIVYTSADSVFQIAAHEDAVPPEQLYEYCRIARRILVGEHGVARVIARPYAGEWPNYARTPRRHDFSLEPTGTTMLDALKDAGQDVLSIGKIYDIFAHRGITDHVFTSGNDEGIERTVEATGRDFAGLCFTNLVDFDMIYGHRNDAPGYARALSHFDSQLPRIVAGLRDDDLLMITADHGCDPVTPSTDHSREYVPWLVCGPRVRAGADLGTRPTFADVSATVLDYLGAPALPSGTSQLDQILEA